MRRRCRGAAEVGRRRSCETGGGASAQRERRRGREERPRVARGVLFLQLGQVGQQFVLLGQTGEVMADHLVGPQRRLAARPQADEHAGDDRAVGLNLDAHRIVAQQVPAAQHVLEEAKEDFDRPAVAVNQGDDPGRQVEQVGGDQQEAVAVPGRRGRRVSRAAWS